jgi:putative transposase
MANYAEVYYHLVWGTRGREHYLIGETEQVVHDFIRYKCRQMDSTVYAVNGMRDHIHVACEIPPSISVSTFVERLKGSSSRFTNQRASVGACLYWQQGYGVLTFSRKGLTDVVAYVDNQKARHNTGRLRPKMEDYGEQDR